MISTICIILYRFILRILSHLVVCVGEKLDNKRQEVIWDNVAEFFRQFLTVHGDMRDLFHQLGSYTRF